MTFLEDTSARKLPELLVLATFLPLLPQCPLGLFPDLLVYLMPIPKEPPFSFPWPGHLYPAVPLSVVPQALHPHPLSWHWSCFPFQVSAVISGCVLTSEGLEPGTSGEREHAVFVLLGLSYLP